MNDCTPLRALRKTRLRIGGLDIWRAKAGSNLLRAGVIRPCRIGRPAISVGIVAQLEQAMKAIKTFKLIGSALIVVVSINAWSQTSESGATSTQSSMVPAGGGSAKATRQANRALSKKVLRALSKGGVNTSRINVIAKGGAVALAGSVTEPTQSDKAGEIAKGVSGVTSVKNDLTLKEVGQ